MEMNIQLKTTSEALDDRHGPAAPVAHAVVARPATAEPEHRANVNGEHRAADLVIPGEKVAQAIRERRDPLPDRDVRQHGVHEVGCPLCHAPSPTARTEAPSLAGERHEALERAAVAPYPCKAAAQHATAQEISELALDEVRQTASVGADFRTPQ